MSDYQHGPARSYERDQFWVETIVFIGLSYFMWSWFVMPIWKSLFFSVLLSIVFRPVYVWCRGFMGQSMSALLVAFVTLLIPVVPLAVATYSAILISNDLIADIDTEGSQTQMFVFGLVEQAKDAFPILERYIQNPRDLLSEDGFIRRNLGSVSNVTQAILATVYSSVISVVFWIGVILFGVYYQLKAGNAPMEYARNILPVRPEFVDDTFTQFAQMARAMIKVTLIVGTVQGTIGGAVLWALGTPYWFLWMFMMIVFSMVPIAGAGVVLVPASLIYIFAVPEWAGLTQGIIIAITFVIVSVVDNIMKPYIVGNDSEMNPGIVLASVVTGLIAFGAIGAFVGPIMAGFGIAYWNQYNKMHSKRHDDFAAWQESLATAALQSETEAVETHRQPLTPRSRVVVVNRPKLKKK